MHDLLDWRHLSMFAGAFLGGWWAYRVRCWFRRTVQITLRQPFRIVGPHWPEASGHWWCNECHRYHPPPKNHPDGSIDWGSIHGR